LVINRSTLRVGKRLIGLSESHKLQLPPPMFFFGTSLIKVRMRGFRRSSERAPDFLRACVWSHLQQPIRIVHPVS
jgi:hypothetical protein